MKKFILITLSILFFAFTFKSDSAPGWYLTTGQINDEISSICFLDTLTGWACTLGDNSPVDTAYIYKTTDGGNNWVKQFSNPGNIDKIKFLDYNTGYAVGNVGFTKVFKTTNGGINWNELGANYNIYFSNDLFFINNTTGWICSDNTLQGGLAKTTDGGASWQLQMTQSYTPKKVFFVNSDTGWVLNNNFKLYKSTNGGSNWFQQYNFGSSDREYMFFLNSSTGIMTGFGDKNFNGIYKTTNGGDNWFRQTNSVINNLTSACRDIFMLSDTLGWIATYPSRILKYTKSNGWGIQTVPVGGYSSIFFFDSTHGFASGTKFIKTDDGGGVVTAIENQNEIVSDYKLYQNYPNPFNPSTNINYELQITNYVTLKVYDLKGKEITMLVNRKQNAGSYEVTFDGSNLSSGIYFYTLNAGEFKETKKMVLIK